MNVLKKYILMNKLVYKYKEGIRLRSLSINNITDIFSYCIGISANYMLWSN